MPLDVHRNKMSFIRCLTIALFCLITPTDLIAESFSDKLRKIVTSKGSSVGVYVYDLKSKTPLATINADKPLKPASVLKVVTSYVALKELGPDYRFKTRLYSTGNVNGTVDNLVVKGEGAPDFTTESIWLLTRQLKKLGVKRVNNIVFDASSFENQKEREGQRAYESMSSALSFNFNSIAIEVCPTRAGQDALVTLDPWDLPHKILSSVKTNSGSDFLISVEEVSNIDQAGGNPLSYKVTGKIGDKSTCRAIYRSISNPPAYFAASFVSFARMINIEMPQKVSFAIGGRNIEERYAYTSRPLSSIVQDLNHYSTNFIGEQILFALGGNQTRDSFNRDRGISNINEVLTALNIPKEQFIIKDGSGLSHDNRFSAYAIVRILEEALFNPSIKPEFEGSLSVLGRSGTLKKRKANLKGGVLRGKTGSLNGVSSLAGYINSRGNRHLAFAIIQNDVTSRDNAEWVEDAIIEEMAAL